MSVPETVTYRELYAAIVKAITPSLKEPISEVVELDDEDDKNESDEETTDSDEIMLGRVKYSADTRSNQVTVNTIPTVRYFELRNVFFLIFVGAALRRSVHDHSM